MPQTIVKKTMTAFVGLFCLVLASHAWADKGATIITPDYDPPKVVFDFFLDDPQKMNSALFWIRSTVNPFMDAPYGFDYMDMDLVVVIHGTEIVTLAKHNEDKYQEAVDRMRYYDSIGVDFHICGMAAEDYGYAPEDLQSFVNIVPSAFTDLVHYQQQGYALITPQIFTRTQSIESIR